MAILKSGATADTLTIDPTSLAMRVTLYNTAGAVVNPIYTGTYSARIDAVPTATADTVFWAMKNTHASKVCYIRMINYTCGFTGTAAATRTVFRFEKFTAGTPAGGQTVMGVAKRYTAAATSAVTDVRGGNVAVTGTTRDTQPLATTAVTSQLAAAFSGNVDLDGGGEEGRIQIGPGEGLQVAVIGTAVLGAWLAGTVVWDER